MQPWGGAKASLVLHSVKIRLALTEIYAKTKLKPGVPPVAASAVV